MKNLDETKDLAGAETIEAVSSGDKVIGHIVKRDSLYFYIATPDYYHAMGVKVMTRIATRLQQLTNGETATNMAN